MSSYGNHASRIASIALLASACARPAVRASPAEPPAGTWERLTHALRGTWVASMPNGAKVTERFHLVSNDSALVESFVTGSGHETMSVYHQDRGGLVLTHYCAQGNQPRLRAVATPDGTIVFRYVDATNLLDGQSVLVEKSLVLRDALLEQTEIYRQPDGTMEKTVFRFAPTE